MTPELAPKTQRKSPRVSAQLAALSADQEGASPGTHPAGALILDLRLQNWGKSDRRLRCLLVCEWGSFRLSGHCTVLFFSLDDTGFLPVSAALSLVGVLSRARSPCCCGTAAPVGRWVRAAVGRPVSAWLSASAFVLQGEVPVPLAGPCLSLCGRAGTVVTAHVPMTHGAQHLVPLWSHRCPPL